MLGFGCGETMKAAILQPVAVYNLQEKLSKMF